jgi:hypothetical protein
LSGVFGGVLSEIPLFSNSEAYFSIFDDEPISVFLSVSGIDVSIVGALNDLLLLSFYIA